MNNSYNTALGYQAFGNPNSSGFTKSTAIGYSSTPTASNQVVLGTASENVYIPGNMGIGTASPGQLLEVQSNGVGTNSQINITSYTSSSTTTNTSTLNLTHQSVSTSSMVNNTIVGKYFSASGGTYGISINPFGINVMNILGTGNVGIGTTSPAYPLDVSGVINTNTKFNTPSYYGSTLPAVNTTSTVLDSKSCVNIHNIQTAAPSGNPANPKFIMLNMVNNGFGGYIYNSFVNFALGIGSGTSNRAAFDINIGGYNDNGTTYSHVPAISILLVNGSARVGINNTIGPSYTLDVNGVCAATTFNTTSDYRLKNNIKPLDSIRTIDLLNPIEYDLSGGKHDMGFLAHEVQEIFPFLVDKEKDGKDMQSMNYNGFIALLVKEVQDLKKENRYLKERMDKLEQRCMV